ncbi:MAG: hypothetical protein AB7S75_20090 [Desulfococcaceae bacterium]
MTGKKIILAIAALPVFMGMACTQHRVQVDPIKTEHVVEVKPMEMTINVNVNVRVDKALDDFFGDIDKAKE